VSSLILRMILRARDPTAVIGTPIEPLLTSRYARMNELPHEAPHSGIADRTAPPEADAVNRAALAAPTQSLQERRDPRPAELEGARIAPTRAATPRFSENAAPLPTEGDAPQAEPSRLAPRVAEAAASPIITRPALAANFEPQREPPRNPLPASRPKDTAGPADPITAAAPVFPVTARISEQPAAARTPASHSRMTSTPMAADAPVAEAPRLAPDITISIGHIEVRSPAPRPAPRRPEFRPRVSLDAFLRRERGVKR
jgi:hypothetical protein